MRSLLNQEDLDQTKADSDSGNSSSRIVKLDSGKNALWFLSPVYDYGYVHWINFDSGQTRVFVCAGDKDGKGWQPDECMLCEYVRGMYGEARETGNKREAEGIKIHASKARAKFEASFIVAKGEVVRQKVKSGGKAKVISVPAFDSDELEIGILRLSKAQFDTFTGLLDSDKFPHIGSLEDLMNRPFIFDKRRHDKKDQYETVKCIPWPRKMEMPEDIEWDADDFDLSALYTVDTGKIEDAASELTGDTNDEDEGTTDITDEEFFDDDDFEDDDV